MNFKIITLLSLSTLLLSSELSLSKAYDSSLKKDPKLKAKYYKVSSKEEEQNQIKSKLYPQLQASISSGYYEYSAEYLKNKKVEENYIEYSISLTQAIYHPEYIEGISQAKSKSDSLQYEYEGDKQNIGLETIRLYINLLKEEEKKKFLLFQKTYFEEKHKEIEKMIQLGHSDKIELTNIKIEENNLKSEVLNNNKKIETLKNKLEKITEEKIEKTQIFNFLNIDISKIIIEKNKVNNNLYLKALNKNIEVSTKEIKIIKYEYYPKVDLSLNRKETSSSDLYVHNYDNQAIIKMTIPIYQGGYTNSKQKENELLLLSAKEEKEAKRKEIEIKYNEIEEEQSLIKENIETLKETLFLLNENLGYIEKAKKVGIKTELNELEEKTKIAKIEKEINENGLTFINNYLILLTLNGDISTEKIEAIENILKTPDGV